MVGAPGRRPLTRAVKPAMTSGEHSSSAAAELSASWTRSAASPPVGWAGVRRARRVPARRRADRRNRRGCQLPPVSTAQASGVGRCPVRRLQDRRPRVGDGGVEGVAVPVGDVGGDRHIGRHLEEGDDRNPAGAVEDVVGAGFTQPIRFVQGESRRPPGDGVGAVLQIHHPRSRPIRGRPLQVGGPGDKPHRAAVLEDRQHLRRAGIAARGDVCPHDVIAGRPDEQGTIGARGQILDTGERRFTAEGAEALAEHHQLRARVLGHGRPPRVDRLEQRLPGLTRAFLIHQERQPAR
ncbi:Uncharacterised protein [Nocardia cyriacigeorgica]|uniref:Uncharacterized protein n=1 Tax=Nocardia cyriacigeorgica TaxID=135487 RepID=A0A4U8VWH2_9NOCA|nr:Uncharacterised protein [Nocardia cyriacigeorgica]